jgi:hypothetical protein
VENGLGFKLTPIEPNKNNEVVISRLVVECLGFSVMKIKTKISIYQFNFRFRELNSVKMGVLFIVFRGQLI